MGLRTNEKRCVTRDCKFYFQSDHIERCGLTGLYLPNTVFKKQECVGYNSIQSKKEEIICKIASLAKEVDYLNDLTERIDNAK